VIMRTYTTIDAGVKDAVSVRTWPAEKRHRGFTFIELIVVVLIIGLLAGTTGMISIRLLRKMRVESDAKHLVLAARYARLCAVERKQDYSLVIDKTGGSFYVRQGGAESTEDESAAMPVSNEYVKPKKLNDGNVFDKIDVLSAIEQRDGENDIQVIVFRPDGGCDLANIEIAGYGTVYSVLISPSGRVRMQEGRCEDVLSGLVVDLDLQEGGGTGVRDAF